MTMIRRLKSTGPLIPQATECGLFYCVKNYTSQVTNGSISESSTVLPTKKSINSWQPLDGTPDPSPDSLSSSVDYARTDLQLNGRFNISQVSINAIGSGMETVFVGSNSSATGATGFALIGPDGVLRQYAPESMQPIYQSTDLNELFNNLAVSMTNNMRSNDDNGTTVVGTTGITVYEIRWPWISLPLIGVILGCVFLAITAGFTKAQNLPIWKSSSLAVLKCGTNVQSLLADETYVGGMTNTAKGANISFFNSEDGKLVTRPYKNV